MIRHPWYVGCRWAVQTVCVNTGAWVDIYQAATKAAAAADATAWVNDTGQLTRVVPGPGHKTRRA